MKKKSVMVWFVSGANGDVIMMKTEHKVDNPSVNSIRSGVISPNTTISKPSSASSTNHKPTQAVSPTLGPPEVTVDSPDKINGSLSLNKVPSGNGTVVLDNGKIWSANHDNNTKNSLSSNNDTKSQVYKVNNNEKERNYSVNVSDKAEPCSPVKSKQAKVSSSTKVSPEQAAGGTDKRTGKSKSKTCSLL